jgi:hypothetical protein
MDFLKFVVTAVLSSALVAAVLLTIITHLNPEARETTDTSDAKPLRQLR